MQIHVIYGLPCVLNIADVIKNNNNTCNKGSSHYFPKKKTVDFRQRKKLKDKKFVAE